MAVPRLALVLTLLAAGCATTPAAVEQEAERRIPALPPDPAPPVVDVPHLEERALLLLLADRRMYEAFTVDRVLDLGPEMRRELAVALARIGGSRARGDLEALLFDTDVEVRRRAAFGLGLLGFAESRAALVRQLTEDDREVGRLAAGALARLETPVDEVLGALLELPEEEMWARLVPDLFRFPRDLRQLETARIALERVEVGSDLHARAAYAMARDPLPEAAPDLARLLADPDPWVRGWAARGLGRVGSTDHLPAMRPLLDDADDGPPVHALTAAARMVADGRAAPPESWRARLVELASDPRPGVRVTALEAAGGWLLDDELEALLAERAVEGEPWERRPALTALARGGAPAAPELLARAARATEPAVRATAARAAGELGDAEVLAGLADDRAPRVRIAALEARLSRLGEEEATPVVEDALADPDPAVRAVAVEWLAGHPVVPLEEVARALAGPRTRELPELGMAGARAIAARGEAEPLERGAAVAILEQLATGADHLVRREASAGLERLGREAPPVGPVATGREPEDYREVVQRTRRDRTVEVRTNRGMLRLRLACSEAPQSCLSFLHLAALGFYDGLAFHRVVPDFVAQGGDPRGDGWGSAGYTLRDEPSRLRYRRGVVGLARSAPDTAGSQFFVTLSAQPHLDGEYTALGEVVAGLEVLDRLVEGDRIESVREVAP